ncbi:hypothetical protein HMPREF9983_09127 [Staphylococcus epidermidis NIHLM023]|nr:hypothetical protein HMPREF9983_09127 [Staphylococcus epidermidis NIHLM023]
MKMVPTILVIKQKSKKCRRSCQQYQKSSESNEMELVKQDGLCIHNL